MSIVPSIPAKIRAASRSKNIPLTDIAKSIGMTEAGLYKMFHTGSIKVRTLEAIAERLAMKVSDFL